MKPLESKVVFMAHDFWLKTLTGCWNSADSVPWTFARISFYTPRVGTCPRDLNVHGQGPLPLTYDRSNYRSGASTTFPLVSWQNTVSISLLVTCILLLFVCGGGPHHGEVTRNVERAPNIWAIKLASSFHSIAQCKKKLLLCKRSVYTIGCCSTKLI